MPRYAVLPKTKQMNSVRNVCFPRRRIFPITKANSKLVTMNSEFEIISPASVENEKGALESAEKINTGSPIFRAKSFKTLDQSSPRFLNFCSNALAKIMRNNGAITVNICVIWF